MINDCFHCVPGPNTPSQPVRDWTSQRSKITLPEHSACGPSNSQSVPARLMGRCHVTCYVTHAAASTRTTSPQASVRLAWSQECLSHLSSSATTHRAGLNLHPSVRGSRSRANCHFFHLTNPLLNISSKVAPFLWEVPLHRVTSWIIESIYSLKHSSSCSLLVSERPCYAGMRYSPCLQKAHSHVI